jgi:NADPH:quinone reductase-like Zn-dependent oxidoreductase
MDSFRAYRINEEDGKIVAGFEELTVDDLTEGNVVVRISYSTINYKDALAATGSGRILRRYPLNGGIDFAGVVVRSEDAEFDFANGSRYSTPNPSSTSFTASKIKISSNYGSVKLAYTD